MSGKDDTIQIRRHELQQILEEVRHVVKLLDELSKERPLVFMIKTRLEALLDTMFDDKTPARPPSISAMDAYRVTSDAADKSKRR